jgi:antitoxin VapB
MIESIIGVMGMAISIKNEATERLAREVAAETGDSLTRAITISLEERLERLKGKRTATDLVSDLLSISRRCAAIPDLDTRGADEILGYNENGTFD